MNEELQEVKEERDALAAHVERWKQWLGQDVEDDTGDWMDEGWSIANEAPATSLARLKAKWRADVLESCENMAETSFLPYLGREEQVVLMVDIFKVAAELRQQAEEVK